MKKVLAVLLGIILLMTMLTVPASALTEDEANAGYYLVGTMTNWTIDLDLRFSSVNAPDEEIYTLDNVRLSTTDHFKVVYSKNGRETTEWYPAGFDNNYNQNGDKITQDGFYTVAFRPNFDGGEDWYYDCIFTQQVTPVDPTEYETTGEPDGGYYLVFKDDNYRISQKNRLNRESSDRYAIHGVTLSVQKPFKIAYSADLAEAAVLYPEGEGNDYIPRYNSSYFTVEFSSSGNNGGSGADMSWYDGYVRAWPCEPPAEDPTGPVTATADLTVNRYEDSFSSFLPGWKELCTYEEVYYHADRNFDGYNSLDWVLVKTEPFDPVDGDSYAVFDDIVLYQDEYWPFVCDYGVYDVRADTYYDITEAWSKNFTDLHDVFINYVRYNGYTDQLGDADMDGELTIIDATWIQRILAGLKDPDDCSWWFAVYGCSFGTPLTSLADYDDSGSLDIIDVTRIQRALAGIELYPHDLTVYTDIAVNSGYQAFAGASFGEEPMQYCYTIKGSFHGNSVYGDDFGRFTTNCADEPGNFGVTTGYISDNAVELPVASLTYNDNFTLIVTAKDAYGRVSRPAVIYWKNNYR